MSCGVGRRHGWGPMLLWLWHRPAATAPIRPLAWKTPYAAGAALEKAKKTKKKKKKKKKIDFQISKFFLVLDLEDFVIKFYLSKDPAV